MVKDYKDYIPVLERMYPDLSRDSIEMILKKGISNLQDLIRRDHDIRLENLNSVFDPYRLILYRSKHTPELKKKRYFVNKMRLEKYRKNKKEKYEQRLQSK